MNITVQDAGNYFRGLLILIGKDGKITEREHALLRHIGRVLGFEKEFCDNAINDILQNAHIADTLPVFSSSEIAKKFVTDGLTIATENNVLHVLEEEWLRSTADLHGIGDDWFRKEKTMALKRTEPPVRMEAEDLIVEYS